ncbi:MAG TPA: hypothetical protein VKE22_08730 [Haliangiales bacterium]|nr:hypothetical protein [Haliangiales bacterium]
MADESRISLYEMSDAVRHWEIAFGGSELARLYVEAFVDAQGDQQSTCRLHFDGDVRAEVMREVIDAVVDKVLPGLPRGMCIVYRGHLVSSFEYGRDRPGPRGAA